MGDDLQRWHMGFLINAGARRGAAYTGVTHPQQPASPALDLPAPRHPIPRLPAAGFLLRVLRAKGPGPPRPRMALTRPPWIVGLTRPPWIVGPSMRRRRSRQPGRAWRPWRPALPPPAGRGW